MHWLKHCEYSNENEDSSLNTQLSKNYQASSQKFSQIIYTQLYGFKYCYLILIILLIFSI